MPLFELKYLNFISGLHLVIVSAETVLKSGQMSEIVLQPLGGGEGEADVSGSSARKALRKDGYVYEKMLSFLPTVRGTEVGEGNTSDVDDADDDESFIGSETLLDPKRLLDPKGLLH